MSEDAAALSVVLRNQRSEVERLGPLAEQFGEAHGLSPDDVFAINLVLDEVVLNVIEYGYDDAAEHQIHLLLSVNAGVLTIQVDDDARAFNPLDLPPPNLDLPIEERPIGGLGVHLVKSTMDTVAYRRDGNRNVLTMTKKLDADHERG
jgi:anti-sigma regulatory factor (Ser/Thr protein kinase)